MSEYDFLKIFESIIDEADVSYEEEKAQIDTAGGTSENRASKSKSSKTKRKNINQNVEEDDEENSEPEDEKTSDAEETESKEVNKSKESSSFGSWLDRSGELRASKSFNDPEVKSELEEYFNRLKEPERKSLILFFKGITQIAAAGIPGDEATTPGDEGLKIVSTGASSTKKEEPKKEKSKKEKPEEPPIIVGDMGESVFQDKTLIFEVLNKIKHG